MKVTAVKLNMWEYTQGNGKKGVINEQGRGVEVLTAAIYYMVWSTETLMMELAHRFGKENGGNLFQSVM